MIRSKLILIIILLALIFGCTSASFCQQQFQVHGFGAQIVDQDVLYLSYRIDGRYVLDSTTVKDHHFTFKGQIGNSPIKASLFRNQNPTHNDNYINDYTELYLENGAVYVDSKDTLRNATLRGTPQNQVFQLLKERLAPLQRIAASIKDPDFFNEEERRDTALVLRNRRLLEANYYKILDAKMVFAKEFSNSFVSLDLVNNAAKNNTYIQQAEEAFNMLSDSIKQSPSADIARMLILKKRMVPLGGIAPEFEMKDIQGKAVKLSSYRGKYLLLDFWASWCLPCRQEHPNLSAIYDGFKDIGFDILSVSIDDNRDNWIAAVAQDRLVWTQVSDLMAAKSDVYISYGISTVPSNFLIDPQGKVIAKDLRGEALKAKIQEVLSNQL